MMNILCMLPDLHLKLLTYKYERVPAILVAPVLSWRIFTVPHFKTVLCFRGHILMFDYIENNTFFAHVICETTS